MNLQFNELPFLSSDQIDTNFLISDFTEILKYRALRVLEESFLVMEAIIIKNET